MFNTQETLFLQAIQNMLSSTDSTSRQKAEQDINLWAKESYQQILETCNKFIICEELDLNIRRYACYIIQILVRDEYYDNWDKLSNELKGNIKNNSLGLLGNKVPEIRISASILVADIKKISSKKKEWTELINTLCNACNSDEIEFKISAIKTIGIICEKLNKNDFTDDEICLMENTIIKNLLSAENKELVYEGLRSYQYFIKYIYEKFKDVEYLKSTLQMLTAFCNIKNYDEKICKIAIHRISNVVLISYDYMETLIKNIIEFFGILCNDENENLAIQSYIFLIELSQEELNRKVKSQNCKNYIDSSWEIIWPVIQNSLNNAINPEYNDDLNRYGSLSDLLYYISKICSENIIDDIFAYMKEKMFSKTISLMNSSIYLFASILESVHRLKLKNVILSSIPILCDFFKFKNENLSETVSWCFEKISENFGELIIRSSDVFQLILNLISENLKSKEINIKIKIYLCTTLYKLTDILKDNELIGLGIFNQYLLDLLKTLDNLAYAPGSYSNDYNLTNYCFIAISGLIKTTPDNNEEILFLYLDKLLERFNEASNIKNFKDNKQYQYQVQDSLCRVLESFCNRLDKKTSKFTYKQIESFFNYIETFFQSRGIFEDGLLALSKLSLLISNKEFSNFMKIIMEHIFLCMKDYQDASNCKTALMCLIDLITTSKENFVPYIEKLIQYFQEIIKKPDANKELFCYFLIIYSDLFEYVGEYIWEYVQIPLEYMKFVLNFCINNFDEYLSEESEKEDNSYFMSLNDNVMDLIENILKRISSETKERQKAFFEYVPNIIYYINFMIQKTSFIPDKDYLLSCMGALFDLVEIYKQDSLKLLQDETSRRIALLSEESKDSEIISLNNALHNFITNSKFYSGINQDDIF